MYEFSSGVAICVNSCLISELFKNYVLSELWIGCRYHCAKWRLLGHGSGLFVGKDWLSQFGEYYFGTTNPEFYGYTHQERSTGSNSVAPLLPHRRPGQTYLISQHRYSKGLVASIRLNFTNSRLLVGRITLPKSNLYSCIRRYTFFLLIIYSFFNRFGGPIVRDVFIAKSIELNIEQLTNTVDDQLIVDPRSIKLHRHLAGPCSRLTWLRLVITYAPWQVKPLA